MTESDQNCRGEGKERAGSKVPAGAAAATAGAEGKLNRCCPGWHWHGVWPTATHQTREGMRYTCSLGWERKQLQKRARAGGWPCTSPTPPTATPHPTTLPTANSHSELPSKAFTCILLPEAAPHKTPSGGKVIQRQRAALGWQLVREPRQRRRHRSPPPSMQLSHAHASLGHSPPWLPRHA